MYMYVNKRVELAQRGIALKKMYVLLLFNIITDFYQQPPVTQNCTLKV